MGLIRSLIARESERLWQKVPIFRMHTCPSLNHLSSHLSAQRGEVRSRELQYYAALAQFFTIVPPACSSLSRWERELEKGTSVDHRQCTFLRFSPTSRRDMTVQHICIDCARCVLSSALTIRPLSLFICERGEIKVAPTTPSSQGGG
jgi:hypothetical protein